MKFAHLADIHVGLGYPGPTPQSRFDDICRAMDWTANTIIAAKCDYVLFAGDFFKDSNIMLNRASVEIKVVAEWLRKLTGAGIKVIMISGTPSHDALAAYEIIKEMRISGVAIYTTPGMFHLGECTTVVCFPGVNRSGILTQDEYRGMQPHEIHQIMTHKITSALQGMKADVLPGKSILMTHITYSGADTGFQDLIMQNEPVLTSEAANAYDLVCLGHIHRPQQSGKVFYPGSIERLSFNDEGIRTGFWIHEACVDGFRSQFIETPSRTFHTFNPDFIDMSNDDIQKFINQRIPDITGVIIRIKYSCTEEQVKIFTPKVIESAFYKSGAFFVAEVQPVIKRTDRARDKDVTESITPALAVAKWAENQGIEAAEIEQLVAMTNELIGGDVNDPT